MSVMPYSVYDGTAPGGPLTILARSGTRKEVNVKEISSDESLSFAGWNIGGYQNPDNLVGRKGLEVYKRMMNDEQIGACMMIKKYARLSTGWDILPGDEKDNLSVELADFSRQQTERIQGTFYDALLNVLTAMEYGYSNTEIVKEYIERGPFRGKIGLKALKTREPFGYGYKVDGFGNLEGIVYENATYSRTDGELGSQENPFPPEEFIVYSYNKTFSNWYGNSDLRRVYRPWFSKDAIIKFYNIYLERYGSPVVWASYPSGMDKKILTAIDNIIKGFQAKSGFRLPEEIKMNLMEASRGGYAGYDKSIEMHNTAIARGILIPELMGYSGRLAGSQALGEVQFNVFIWVLEKLGRDIEETIVGEQLFRRLIDINYDVQSPEQYPKFRMGSLKEDNIESRAKILEILVKNGIVDGQEDWVREYMLLPNYEPPTNPMPKPTAPPAPPENKPSDDGGEKLEPEEPEGEPVANVLKYQLKRQPTEFESKVGFDAFTEKLYATDKLMRDGLAAVFKKQREKLLRDVERVKPVENKDFKFIDKLQLQHVGDIKKVVQQTMVKAHLDSKLQTLEEIERGGVPIRIVNKFQGIEDVAFQPWVPVPPTQAVEQFNAKVLATIVTEEGVKKVITMGKMSELKYYDSRAFAITGVERDYVLKEAKLILQTGIKQGLSNREIMGQLNDIFDKFIATGAIKDGKIISPNRLETIVRTNVSDAINQGRRTMMFDPLVRGFVPYFMVSAIIDDRTTEICEWLDGKIFKLTDADATYPPYHYNCRTVVVSITSPEVDALNKKGEGVEVADWNANPYPPMKGFIEIDGYLEAKEE